MAKAEVTFEAHHDVDGEYVAKSHPNRFVVLKRKDGKVVKVVGTFPSMEAAEKSADIHDVSRNG